MPFGGVIHGSNPCGVVKSDLDLKLDRAALKAVWQAIAHSKISASFHLLLLFFWLLLADLTLLTRA
jgi:hypothetical protein